MMRQRLFVVPLAGLTAVLLVLSGCGGGTGADTAANDDGGHRTIRVVVAEYSKSHTRAFWENLDRQYERETGNTVDLQVVDWNVIDQQVTTMIQNNQPPDILNLNSFASYARDGLLYPTSEILSRSVRDDILAPFVAGGELDGTQYATPVLASARALFYNKELFRQAGIARPPASWDDFRTAAERISALGHGTIGYALPLGPEEAQAEFSLWMWNNGGDWQDGTGQWTINSARNVETLRFLADLTNTRHVTQVNPGRTNRTDGAFSLFEDGRVGMVMGFSPLAAELDRQRKVTYGVAQLPTRTGTPITLAVQDFLMAFKRPTAGSGKNPNNSSGSTSRGNRDAVSAYLNLYYRPENVTRFVSAEGFLPVTHSSLSRMSSQPELTPYLNALPHARQLPTNDPAWDQVKVAAQQNIGAGVQPGTDPKRVLDQIQRLAEQASAQR